MTTTTHNHAPQVIPELTPAEKSLFSLDKLNEWRTHEDHVLVSLREADNFTNQDYDADFNASVNDLLDGFLRDNELEPDSPHYSEIRQLFYEARLGRGNGDGISEYEWEYSPASRGTDPSDHKSQKEYFKERITDRIRAYNSSTDSESADMIALITEALVENARFDVSKSRDNWAKAASKRLGRAFSVKDADREKIKENYHASVQKLGKLELQTLLEDDTVSAQDKNVAVIEFLFDEQAKLREKTLENLKGTKVSKFVEFMNRGKLSTRIAKGVGLGVVAGVGGSFLAGAAGAGAIAAGAVGFSRFVKGYAAKDKHRGSTMGVLDDTEKQLVTNYLNDATETTYSTMDEAIEDLRQKQKAELDRNDRGDTASQYDVVITDIKRMKKDGMTDADFQAYQADRRLRDTHSLVNNFFETDVKDEQKERRKSLYWGVGTVAVGSALGYGMHAAAEMASNKDLTLVDNAAEKMKNFFQHGEFENDPSAPSTPDTDADSETTPSPDTGDNGGADPATPNPEDATLTRGELFDGYHGTRSLTDAGHEALTEQFDNYKVKPGDSVWSLSEQFLNEQGVKNPSVYEIDATKDVLLKEFRATGAVDSRGWLTVGDKIRIK